MYDNIYVPDHSLRLTRYVHLVGTVVGTLFACYAAKKSSLLGVIGAVSMVYAFAVPSHPIIQGNRPSSLKGWRTAILAVPADLMISWQTLINPFTGAMDRSLKRANIRPVTVG
ncbi:MAG: DUF962 domain-containing protein [Chlamydiales bacterium]|nr:DUF962 domain-containing protein [Chlamydiia bacterium]MCP5507156.1 DUF962 domain-containing protein [Chlamydiales bacterium]